MEQKLQLFVLLIVWLALTIYPNGAIAGTSNTSHTTSAALTASLYNNCMQITADNTQVADSTDLDGFPLSGNKTDPSLRNVLNGGSMEKIDSKLDNSPSQL